MDIRRLRSTEYQISNLEQQSRNQNSETTEHTEHTDKDKHETHEWHKKSHWQGFALQKLTNIPSNNREKNQEIDG